MKLSARYSAVFVFISVMLIQVLTVDNICFAESEKLDRIKNISKVNNYAITDWYEGSSDKFAIAVQDLHANYAAQKVYDPFLNELFGNENEFNIQFIGVEGTTGLIDTSFASSYPDKNIKKIISDRLMKSGFISGFEYFTVNRKKPVLLYGIDDRERYIKNTELYFRISRDLKPDVVKSKQVIAYYLDSVNSFCEENLNPEEFDLYRHFRDFHEFKVSHIQFAEYLKQVSAEQNIDLSGYNQFNLLLELWEVQSRIEPSRLESEKNILLSRLKQVFSEEDYSKLLRCNMSFSLGKISATAFYNLFFYYMDKYSVNVAATTNLENMLSLIRFADSIKEPLLNKELYSIVDGIFNKANWSSEHTELFSITTMLYVMHSMFDLKASRWQYDFYESSCDQWSLRKIYAGLKKMINDPYSVVFNEKDIKTAEHLLSLSRRFYQQAVERDLNMFDNAYYMNNALNGDTMVFITGGFHSGGITDILRERDISYVVVTPRVSADQLSSVYDSVMLNSLSVFDSLLSPMQTRLIPSSNFNNLINPDNRTILMAKWAVYAGVLQSAQNMDESGLAPEQLSQRFAVAQEEWMESAIDTLHLSLDPLVKKGVISEAFVSSRIQELQTALDRIEYDFERSRVFEKSLAIPLIIKDDDSKEVIVNVKEQDGDPAEILEIFDNLDVIRLDKFNVEIWPKEAFIVINELNRLLEGSSKQYSLDEKQNFVVLLDLFGAETLERVMHTFSNHDMKDLLDIVPSREQLKKVISIIGIENSTRLFTWDPRGFFNLVYVGSRFDESFSSDQLIAYVDQLLTERATFRSKDKSIPVFLVQDATEKDLTEWFSHMIPHEFDLEYWSEVLSTNEIFVKALSPTGVVIGLMSARYHSEGNAVVIDVIETSADTRRMGVGRDLIKEAVNRSMQAGYDGRLALVPKSDSKPFYQALGFILHPDNSTFFLLTPENARNLVGVSSIGTDADDFSLKGEKEKILELQNEPILDSINRVNGLLGNYENITYDDLLYIAAQLMRIQASDENEAEKIVNDLMQSEASFDQVVTNLYDVMVDRWMAESDDLSADLTGEERQTEGKYGVPEEKFTIINDNLGSPFVAVPFYDDKPQLPVVIKSVGKGDLDEWFSYDIVHEIDMQSWRDNITEDTFFMQAVAPNGKIVGLAIGVYDEQADSVRIKIIETALPVRNFGVAKTMIKEMAHLSYRAGFNGKIILNASDESEPIYRKIGFSSYSSLPEELILMPKEAYNLLELSFKPSIYLSENINLFDDSKHVPELFDLTRLRSLFDSYSSLYLWDREFIIDQLKQAYGITASAALTKFDSIMKDEISFQDTLLQLYDVMLDSALVNSQGEFSFSVNVLPAETGDLSEWFSYDIRREFVSEHWVEALSNDYVVFFKAVSPSGRIVGLIAAEFDPADNSFSILRSETCITARYLGVGKNLVSQLASQILENGMDGGVKVVPRKGTESFFTSLGFQKEGQNYTLTPENAVKLKDSQKLLRFGRKHSDLFSRLSFLKEIMDTKRAVTEDDKFMLVYIIDQLYDLPDESREIFIDYLFKSDENTFEGVSLLIASLTDALIGQSKGLSSPMLRIEKANEDDLEKWFAYGIPRQIMRMGWKSTLGDEAVLLKAVSPSGRIIGLMCARPGLISSSSDKYDAYKIEYIESCLTASNTGIGTALIKEAIKLSSEAGYEGKIALDSNISATEFYLNLGFDFVPKDTDKSVAKTQTYTQRLALQPDKAEEVLKKNVPAQLTPRIETLSSSYTFKSLFNMMNSYGKLTYVGRDALTELAGSVLGATADYMKKVFDSEPLFNTVTTEMYNSMMDQKLLEFDVMPLVVEEAKSDDLNEWFDSPISRQYSRRQWDSLITSQTRFLKVISPTGRIVGLAAFTQDDELKSFNIQMIDTCVSIPENQSLNRLINRLSHLSFMKGYEGRLSAQTNSLTDDIYKVLGFLKSSKNEKILFLNSQSALDLIGSYTFLDYKKLFPEFDRLPADAVVAKINELTDKYDELSYEDKAFISAQLIQNYGVTPFKIDGIWKVLLDSQRSYREGLEQLSFAVMDKLLVSQDIDMGNFTRIEKASRKDISTWYSSGIDRVFRKEAWQVNKFDEMVFYKAVSPSGRILGMVSYYIDENVEAVQIGTLEVCSTVENSSVGKELVKQVVRESFNSDYQGRVVIDSSIHAMSFYESLGFIELPDRVDSFGLLPVYAEEILGVDSYSANERVLKNFRQIPTLDAIQKLSGLMDKYAQLTVNDKTFIAAQIMNVYLLTPSQTEQMLNKFLQSEAEYRQGINSLYNMLSDSWSARQNAEKDLSVDRPAVRPVFSSELPDAQLTAPATALPELHDYVYVLNKMIDIKKMLGSPLDTSFDKPLVDKPSTVNLAKSFLRKHGIAVDIRIVPSDDPRVQGRTAVLLDNVIYVNENTTRGEFWFYLPHEVSHILDDENKAQIHNAQQISYLKGLSDILITQARTLTDRGELKEALFAMGVNIFYNALSYELDILTAKLQLTKQGEDFLRSNGLPLFENVNKSYLYSVASSSHSVVRSMPLPETALTIKNYVQDTQIDEKESVGKLRYFVVKDIIEHSVQKAKSRHNQIDNLLSSWVDIQFNRRFWQVSSAKIPKQLMPYVKQSVDEQGIVDIRDIQRVFCEELRLYPAGTEKTILEQVLAQWIAELIRENISPLEDVNELHDVFQQKQANCSGYSKLFNMIAPQFGLNTRMALLEVEYEGSLQLHAVNLVNLSNGKWEILDLIPSGGEIKRVYVRVRKDGEWAHDFISNEKFLSVKFDQIDGLSQDVIDAVTFNTRATVANAIDDVETALYNMNIAYELDPESPYIASNLAEMIFANWIESIKKFGGFPSQEQVFEKARTLYYEFDLERMGPDSWKNFYDTVAQRSKGIMAVGSIDGVNGPGGSNFYWRNRNLKKPEDPKQPVEQQPESSTKKVNEQADGAQKADSSKLQTDNALLRQMDAQAALNRMSLNLDKKTVNKDTAKAIQQYQTTQMVGNGLNFNSARRLIQLGGQISALIQQQQFAKAEQMMMGLDPGFATRVMMQFPWIMAYMIEFYPEWWKGDDLKELARKARLPEQIRAMVNRQLTTVRPVTETRDRDEFHRYPRINPLWALFQKAQLAKQLKQGIDNDNLTDHQFRLLFQLLGKDQMPSIQDLTSDQKTVLFGKRDEIPLENRPSIQNGFLFAGPFMATPALENMPLYENMVKTVVDEHPHEFVSVLAEQPGNTPQGLDIESLKVSRGGLSVLGENIFESARDDDVLDFLNNKPQDNVVSEIITAVFTTNLLHEEKLFFLNNVIQSGMLDYSERAVLSYFKRYYVDGDENTTFFQQASLLLQDIIVKNEAYREDLFYLGSKLRTVQPGNLLYAMLRLNVTEENAQGDKQIIPFPQSLSETRSRLLDSAM